MKRYIFNYIKGLLIDYPNLDKYIKERREELMHPYKPADINRDIKGNKISNPMENALITIDQDRRLAALEKRKMVISNRLRDSDPDTQTIIQELYIKKHPQYTMDGLIANQLIYCGRTKAFELQNEFFEDVAKDLNLDD